MNERKKITIICAGDSITDCDCVKPPIIKDTTMMRDLGYGYVNMLFGMLSITLDRYDIRLLNYGVGGDRTIKLRDRFDQVLSQPADLLTIMIGVNDVWAKFYASERPDVQTSVDEYVQYLIEMITKAKKIIKHIVLVSPFYLDLSSNHPFLHELKKRQHAMEIVAKDYGLLYVNLQREFEDALQMIPVSNISTDFIHVNAIGHMIIANRLSSVIKQIIINE